MENGDAILWKNILQLSPKNTCKKHSTISTTINGEMTYFIYLGTKYPPS